MIGIDLSKLAGVYYNDVLVDALVMGNTMVWENKSSEQTVDVSKALKFTAVGDSVDLGFENNDGLELYWSDGFTDFALWDGTPLTISQNESIYIKGQNTSFYNDRGYKHFTTSGNGKLECEGSVMYLLGEDVTEITETGCFLGLFSDCTNLETAPELPATSITQECYSCMFIGCTSLRTAPELPATTLADYCYQDMFSDCTSLVNAPVLPATELATQCYAYMFYGCTSLDNAPTLPATTLTNWCYSYMFYGCTSLTTAPELPATTLANYCYDTMFYGCTSLVHAPVLPATTVKDSCYQNMFQNCTSLNFDTTGSNITLKATNFASNCYYGMFRGCTSLTAVEITGPDGISNTTSNSCTEMFKDCTSLSYIKALFVPGPSFFITSYQKDWVTNVAPSGTFVCKESAQSAWRGVSIHLAPNGWEITPL